MHTVNLLTEQADLSTLGEAERALHARFIEGQRVRQQSLRAGLSKVADKAPLADEAHFQAGFKFLQCCDSFSLFVGVAYPEVGTLRHAQPLRGGGESEITLRPLGNHRYTLAPYPLDESRVEFVAPYRRVAKKDTVNLERFQAAYADATPEAVTIHVQSE